MREGVDLRITHEDGGGGGGARRETPGALPERPLAPAILRGARGRCPNCGAGPVFAGYLTVAPACTTCGEVFSGHRSDDLPPYLTILLVGHVVVSGLLLGEKYWQPDLAVAIPLWLTIAAVLTLLLLRPIKGGVVGLQWALRLHGFARPRGAAPETPSSFPPPDSPSLPSDRTS